MAPHVHKRVNLGPGPAQSSITSFFHTSSNNAQTPLRSGTPPPPAISIPALPAAVQSNLLSVGMRIRKSIPEGYKTGSPYGGFTLFAESPVSPRTVPGARGHAGGMSLTQSAAAAAAGVGVGVGVARYATCNNAAGEVSARRSAGLVSRAASRELTPFCGLLKVGGLDVQSFDEDSMDDMPPLSSQGSTVTLDSTWSGDTGYCSWDGQAWTPIASVDIDTSNANGTKRRWEDDDEASVTVVREPLPCGQERVFKVPRTMQTKPASARGQENATGDFGDADFLDYGCVAGVHEVEMGGL